MKNIFRSLLIIAFMGVNMVFAKPSISLTESVEHVAISTESGTFTLTPETLSLLDSNAVVTTGLLAKIFSMGPVLLLIPLFLAILITVVSWRIYSKAGYPGWHSVVPVLNIISFARFTGTGLVIGSLFLLSFLPIVFPDFASILPLVSLILSFWMVYKIARSFGRGIGFTFGLLFLGIIFAPILAFNNDIKYVGPGGKTF